MRHGFYRGPVDKDAETQIRRYAFCLGFTYMEMEIWIWSYGSFRRPGTIDLAEGPDFIIENPDTWILRKNSVKDPDNNGFCKDPAILIG